MKTKPNHSNRRTRHTRIEARVATVLAPLLFVWILAVPSFAADDRAVKIEGAGIALNLAENWELLDPNYFNLLKTLLESRGGNEMRYGEILMMFQRGPREQFIPLQTPFMIVMRSENIVSPQAVLVAYFKAGGIMKDGAKKSRDLISAVTIGDDLTWDTKLGMLLSNGEFRLPTGMACPFRGFTLPTKKGAVQFVIFDGIVPVKELPDEIALMMSKLELEESIRVDQDFVEELMGLIETAKKNSAGGSEKVISLLEKWDLLWKDAEQARSKKDPKAASLYRQANAVAIEALKTRYGTRAEWLRRDLTSTVREADAWILEKKIPETESRLKEAEKKLDAVTQTSQISDYVWLASDYCNTRKNLELLRDPPNFESAIDFQERAIEFFRLNFEANPSFSNHWTWVKAMEPLGNLQKIAGRLEVAEATFVDMLNRSQSLLSERPHACSDFYQMRYALYSMITLTDQRGAFRESYQWRQQRADYDRLLTKTHPDKENWRLDRIRDVKSVLDYAWDKKLEEWPAIDALYSEVFAAVEAPLAEEDGTDALGLAIDLYWSRRDRLQKLDPPRREEALADAKKAVELERIRYRRNPSTENRRLLAIRVGDLGMVQKSAEAFDDAIASWQEACEIGEPLLKSGEVLHRNISNMHNYYGDLATVLGKAKDWVKSIDYRERRAEYLRHRWEKEEPENASLAVYLAETLRGTGDIMLREKIASPSEGERLREDAIALLKRLEKDGTNTETGRTRLKDWTK